MFFDCSIGTTTARWIAWAVVTCPLWASVVSAQDTQYKQAPPKHAVMSNTINGWYFVPSELKERYETTVQSLEALQSNIGSGEVNVAKARSELANLKQQLDDIRKKIEASRIHVEGAAVVEQTESMEFELGPEKRLAIRANQVHVIGWDKPYVDVQLKKQVLAPNDKPVEDQLKNIAIVHQHARAEFAGKTDEEWTADEAAYLAKEGANASPESLKNRKDFLDEIRQSYRVHRPYVGKTIDLLSVSGLEYQNNPSITMAAQSNGGEGQMGSVRQRYGELTVYVPKCTGVVIRGARRGLQIENLEADLTVVDEDSTDINHRGRFDISGLKGNLICKNFPLHSIADVDGHVTYEATSEFGFEGSGTSHHDDVRDIKISKPFHLRIHQVTQGLDAKLGRMRLDLQDVQGKIDVLNEYGDTRLVVASPLTAESHRIVSYAGRIDVELSKAAWEATPVVAATNHGGVRTNLQRPEFDDFHMHCMDKIDQVRRDWQGFRKTTPGEDRMAVFNLVDRFTQVLHGQDRSNGLDLISRGGSLSVLRN